MGFVIDWEILKVVLPIAGYGIGILISYTKLQGKVSNLEETFKQKMNDVKSLKQQINEINKTLNQIVGKIDLFFSSFCNNQKNQ